MFSNKIWFFLYKKLNQKIIYCCCLTFSLFSFFCLFFQCFSFVSCNVKQYLCGLKLYWDFFPCLRSALCSTWKKNQVQIIVFNKKTVLKISRISNSKSPPWNLAKFPSAPIFVGFDCEWKTIKTHGFYGNGYLHTSSICLRLVVSSLTETQYLQIEPCGKAAHINESIWCLKCFIYTYLPDEQSAFDRL